MYSNELDTYNPRHDYFDMEEAPPPLSYAQARHMVDQVGAGLEFVGIVGLPLWFCAILGACYHLVQVGGRCSLMSEPMFMGFLLLLAAISGFLSAMICFRVGGIVVQFQSYPMVFLCHFLTGLSLPVLGYFFGLCGLWVLLRWDIRCWFYRPAPHPSELEPGVPHQLEELRAIERGWLENPSRNG
jgi:hypothetical protein